MTLRDLLKIAVEQAISLDIQLKAEMYETVGTGYDAESVRRVVNVIGIEITDPDDENGQTMEIQVDPSP